MVYEYGEKILDFGESIPLNFGEKTILKVSHEQCREHIV